MISRQPTQTHPELSNNPGLRSAEAFIRPSPIATHGDVLEYGFSLKNATFTLHLNAPSATPEDAPTEIFLPDFHFPADRLSVEVTGGKWRLEVEEVNGQGMQWLRWWHGEGEQSMTVKGVVKKAGSTTNQGDEPGYFETMRKVANECRIM